ncbi:MAG: flagellar motor stator protein MotA, partial [Alcaligenaceae bacterium]|nr:flagellar motor stator protein MotA [Alcaligenaceae bacterium]
MLVVIGYVVVLLSVFGAYVGMGGHLSALFQPLELVLIGGAALGAYIAANSLNAIKLLLQDILQLMKKSKYDKALYLEILSCLFVLMRKSKSEGKNAIESHIEEPESSDIFAQYPMVLADKIILNFICDYFRMIITSNMSAFELEQLMDEEIETCRSELSMPHKGLRAVGDGLPAFGIVAAVLGVVKAL